MQLVMRLGAVCLVLAVFWVPILQGVARLWIVDEAVEAADAIIVLGGAEDCRPFAAARLWKAGLAPVVLVPEVELNATEALGLRPSTTAVIRGVLKAEGVPDEAVVSIGRDVSSTRHEALAVREWVERRGVAAPVRLLIPTDPFPTRRTHWLFEKTVPGARVTVVRTDPKNMDAEHWWTSETGLISFQNEVVKYLLYRAKY